MTWRDGGVDTWLLPLKPTGKTNGHSSLGFDYVVMKEQAKEMKADGRAKRFVGAWEWGKGKVVVVQEDGTVRIKSDKSSPALVGVTGRWEVEGEKYVVRWDGSLDEVTVVNQNEAVVVNKNSNVQIRIKRHRE